MPLDSQKKLRIFLDNFVNYVWIYIEIQKNLKLGQAIPNYTTPFECLPVTGNYVDLAPELQIFMTSSINKAHQNYNIDKIFPGSKHDISKILSIAIQAIVAHIESYLIKLQDNEEVKKFAAAAVKKLINYLSANEVKECNVDIVVKALLKQDNNNLLFSETNANFIARSLNNLVSDEQNSSIVTKIDSSAELVQPQTNAITEQITNDNFLITQKQIIISEELESIEKFGVLGTCKFQSDLASLRIDKFEKLILQLEKVVNKTPVYFDNLEGGIANFYVELEDELHSLNQYFNDNDGGIQVIGGSGGVVKTQLVLSYINQHIEDYENRVRWIKADSQESIEKSFKELAEDLSIEGLNYNFDQVRKLVLIKLEKEIDKSLLVFANAFSKDMLKDYIPNFNKDKKHDIIITTQNAQDWEGGFLRENCNIIRLEDCFLEDAQDIEKSVLGGGESIEEVELANFFSSMPLSYKKALDFILVSKVKIKDYLENSKVNAGNSQDPQDFANDYFVEAINAQFNTKIAQTDYQIYFKNSQIASYFSSLSAQESFYVSDPSFHTDSESFTKLEQMVDSFVKDVDYECLDIFTPLKLTLSGIKEAFPDAFKILKLGSYLNAELIPLKLFDAYFDLWDKGHAITVLYGHSFLSVSENKQFANMSRIVQKIIIQAIPFDKRFKDIKELAHIIIIQGLFTLNYSTEAEYINNKSNFLHVKSLIHKAKKYTEVSFELIYLKLALAVYHNFTGDFEQAEGLLLSLKNTIEELSYPNDLKIFISKLAEISKMLPTLYADIYYYLGKAKFSVYLKEIKNLNNLDNEINKSTQDFLEDLDKALEIRKIIKPSYNSDNTAHSIDLLLNDLKRCENLTNLELKSIDGYEFNLYHCWSLYVELFIKKLEVDSNDTKSLKMLDKNLSIKNGDINTIIESKKLSESCKQYVANKRSKDENFECDDFVPSKFPGEIVINAAINQHNLLVEKIDIIKNFVGEENINNNYSGFYTYIGNSLSNNLFSNFAKQIINTLYKLVINLSLLISQENTEDAEDGSLIWAQIEYLLEFTASGQNIVFRRAPSGDPDGGHGDQGGDVYGLDILGNNNFATNAENQSILGLISNITNEISIYEAIG